NDPADARRRLAPMCEQTFASGIPEPGRCHFVADYIEACIRLGDHEEAEARLAVLEDRSRAVGRTWGLATAARNRPRLAASQGRCHHADRGLAEAFEPHADLSMPRERARTPLVAGEVHRRARRKRRARDAFNEAERIFEGLGGSVWRARAAEEAARIGVV